jgi:hypothetical protein
MLVETRSSSRYIAGIIDEPQEILCPIRGYSNEPLLSLEDACIPFIKTVSNLDTHVQIAKKNCQNPLDNLTTDESASIHLYTMEW